MRYDIIGSMLICAAAFLYAARYIAAAIFMTGVTNWNAELFRASYSYVGNGLTIWSTLALIAGLGAIVAGTVAHSRKQNTEHNKSDAGDS